MVSLPDVPHHHHLGKLPNTDEAEASSSNVADSKERGFSCFPSLFIDLLQITISVRKWRPLQVKDITTVIIGILRVCIKKWILGPTKWLSG